MPAREPLNTHRKIDCETVLQMKRTAAVGGPLAATALEASAGPCCKTAQPSRRPSPSASSVRIETGRSPRPTLEFGTNQVHGFRMQLANPRLGHAQHFPDFTQAALLFVVQREHQTQAFRQGVDRRSNAVDDFG